jgi:TatD DNase family protein
VDSHCHLQDPATLTDGAWSRVSAPDPPTEAGANEQSDPLVGLGAAKAAAAAGILGLVCVGTDETTSRQAVALSTRAQEHLPGCWLRATVGIHPHEAAAGIDGLVAVLDESQRAGLVGVTVTAIGECGLDYHYDHAPRDRQRQVFADQVALAQQLGLTLVVHTRDAWDDTFAILSAGAPERTVIHCFTGGVEEARRALDLGAVLSFSGIVTFKNAGDVREAAAFAPEDRILVETDAPFLAPVPHRGKPNQPAWVAVVGEAVATVRQVPSTRLAAVTTATAQALFLPD